jgi:hypothetical protein
MAQKKERAMDGAHVSWLVWHAFPDELEVVLSHPWRKDKNAPRMGHPFSCVVWQLSPTN